MEHSEWLEQIEPVLKMYPNLRVVEGELRLKGFIEVRSESNGELLESFDLDILFPEDYPSRFPLVWETGEKIPRIADRHVMPDNGNLCLAVQPEERLICAQGINALQFFEGVLHPRLVEEVIVRNGGKYRHEYSHGIGGVWEFYQRYLKIPEPTKILSVLRLIILNRLPADNKPCVCGSQLKYGHCHKDAIETIRTIDNVNSTNFNRLYYHWLEVQRDKNVFI